MRLEDYVEEFSKILGALQEKEWSAEVDKAEGAMAILQEAAKDRRMESIEARRQRSGKVEPATEKQKEYMDDLEILYEEGVTKEKASKEIESALDESSSKERSG